jgi:hypothetical protein
MNIYILERIARRNHSEMFNGFVIVADTYAEARQIAQVEAGKQLESGDWLDEAKTTCKIVDRTTKGIVLSDFAEG